VVGGVQVESGDVVVADADGVVIVPRSKLAIVLKALDEVRAAEAALEAKVKGGLEIPDFVRAILDSDRVAEIS
jgi:4-hydroxy-4-methyl-2-oxoglutarate aldolase